MSTYIHYTKGDILCTPVQYAPSLMDRPGRLSVIINPSKTTRWEDDIESLLRKKYHRIPFVMDVNETLVGMFMKLGRDEDRELDKDMSPGVPFLKKELLL